MANETGYPAGTGYKTWPDILPDTGYKKWPDILLAGYPMQPLLLYIVGEWKPVAVSTVRRTVSVEVNSLVITFGYQFKKIKSGSAPVQIRIFFFKLIRHHQIVANIFTWINPNQRYNTP